MKLAEYLKYRGSRALTNAECRAIGVDYKRGSVKRHADNEIPQELVDALRKRMGSPNSQKKSVKKAARKAIKQREGIPRSQNIERPNTYRKRSEAFLKSRAWKELGLVPWAETNG